MELPAGSKPLSVQVSGHVMTSSKKGKVALLENDDGTVLKAVQQPPRGDRELNFYEKVFDPNTKDPVLLQLQPLLPKYHGCETYSEVRYMRLQNLVTNFVKPCVTDLKMGAIVWGPDSTAEKIAKQKTKYPDLKKICFQIGGIKTYYPKTDEYKSFGKDFTRSLNEEEVLTKGMPAIFDQGFGIQYDIAEVVLRRLQPVSDWFETQKQWKFFGSSILIAYEGDPERQASYRQTDNGTVVNDMVEVKLIDFAHAWPSDGNLDENYLGGLRNLLNYLKRLVAQGQAAGKNNNN